MVGELANSVGNSSYFAHPMILPEIAPEKLTERDYPKTVMSIVDDNDAYLGKRIVQDAFKGYGRIAIITAPYRKSSGRFEAQKIPQTYLNQVELSVNNLSQIPLESIVGFGSYCADAGEDNSWSRIGSEIIDDISRMDFAQGINSVYLAVNVADVLRTESEILRKKDVSLDFGSKVYALFIDNKPKKSYDIADADYRSFMNSKSICLMYKESETRPMTFRERLALARDNRCQNL